MAKTLSRRSLLWGSAAASAGSVWLAACGQVAAPTVEPAAKEDAPKAAEEAVKPMEAKTVTGLYSFRTTSPPWSRFGARRWLTASRSRTPASRSIGRRPSIVKCRRRSIHNLRPVLPRTFSIMASCSIRNAATPGTASNSPTITSAMPPISRTSLRRIGVKTLTVPTG